MSSDENQAAARWHRLVTDRLGEVERLSPGRGSFSGAFWDRRADRYAANVKTTDIERDPFLRALRRATDPAGTGATSGIGRATAQAFAREGASVVVADIAAEGNQETARMIEQAGGQSLAVTCDVMRGDDIKAALHAAVERFGRLDIAFNNAGIEQPIKAAAESARTSGTASWRSTSAVSS